MSLPDILLILKPFFFFFFHFIKTIAKVTQKKIDRQLRSREKSTFSSQRKAGSQHAVNHKFSDRCQTVRT